MGIAPNFTRASVEDRINAYLERVDKAIINRLMYLGEKCQAHARENGGYLDQTGNLRSSVGYIVFKNGRPVAENFPTVKDGSEGSEKGKNLAERISSRYSNGYVLIVVAGMSYAVAVESRGRDVLASAEDLAKQMLPDMLKQLKRNSKKAFNELL